uniref:Uncharacterized protein n=1 Tax=Arundo donax TaxID=35708 RepID=A0A0A8ZXQ1_ARUDO
MNEIEQLFQSLKDENITAKKILKS